MRFVGRSNEMKPVSSVLLLCVIVCAISSLQESVALSIHARGPLI